MDIGLSGQLINITLNPYNYHNDYFSDYNAILPSFCHNLFMIKFTSNLEFVVWSFSKCGEINDYTAILVSFCHNLFMITFTLNLDYVVWSFSKCDEINFVQSEQLKKHCLRHNGPEGWVLLTKVTYFSHITRSNTKFSQISSSEY